MKMFLPPYIKKITSLLEDDGHEVFAVGGCVRDWLLGLTPGDYDLAVSALPEQVRAVLTGGGLTVHDTGLQHGTVTAVCDGNTVELTTFRIDGNYSDNRRPDSVRFTRNLKDDLSRRDFTINAMAYSDKTGIVDMFGGRADLDSGVIRAVGEPRERFKEDGLRVLRALRFAAVYGFSIDQETARAAQDLRGLIQGLAGERIAQELNKTVCGKVSEVIFEFADVFGEIIPEIVRCKGFEQHSKYHDRDVLTHTLNAMDASPPDKITRLALLFHDMGKPSTFNLRTPDGRTNDTNGLKAEDCSGSFKGHAAVSAETAQRVMRRLKYDNATFRQTLLLVKHHDLPIYSGEKELKRLLNRFGAETLFRLIDIHIADNAAKSPEYRQAAEEFRKAKQTAADIIEKGDCFSLKQMAVKGSDIIPLGYKGSEISDALNRLLQAVIDGECENDRDGLLEILKSGRTAID